jgi:hypothetical protein
MTMIGAVLAVMMNTASASVLPLALPVVAYEVLESKKEARAKLRKLKNDRLAVCRKGAKAKHDPQRLMTDVRINIDERRKLAGLYWTGEDCRQDQGKAIALLDAIVGTDPTANVNIDDVQRLLEYHRSYGQEKSSSRIANLSRMLWMRGRYTFDERQLGWDYAGMKAFVLSDPIWSWFEKDVNSQFGYKNYLIRAIKLQALLDPASPRFDFEKGLGLAVQHGSPSQIHAVALALEEGKIVPRDAVRAATLLWSNRTWGDTHALLVKRITPLLDDPDTAVRAKALADMQELASLYTLTMKEAKVVLIDHFLKHLKSPVPGEAFKAQQGLNSIANLDIKSVSAILMPLIDKQLKSGNFEQKAAAHSSLYALTRAGDVQAKALSNVEIEKAIKQAGGITDLKTTEGLRFGMSNYDYPTRAIRNEEEGLVSVTVIVGPDGKAIKVDQATGAWPSLVEEVSKIALRRTHLKGYEGRYVRVRLPDVQFRLGDCEKDRPPTQAPPNTIVVTAICIRPTV